MSHSTKPLPGNERVLELLLEQANRFIDYIEPILRSQQFRAEQIQAASRDLSAVAPALVVLRAIKSDLDKHMALDGPDIDELMTYVEPEATAELVRHQEPAVGRLTAIARAGPITQEVFSDAGRALAEVVSVQGGILNVVKALRGRIIAKLSESAEAPAKIEADKTPDKSTEKFAAKPVRLPRNSDIMRLAREIQKGERLGLPKIEVALEFTKGDRRRAESLLRGLRRHQYLNGPETAK